MVANPRRASFRPYGFTSFPRKVANPGIRSRETVGVTNLAQTSYAIVHRSRAAGNSPMRDWMQGKNSLWRNRAKSPGRMTRTPRSPKTST